MKLLSLDLGITTGYCVQSRNGVVLAMGHLKFEGEDPFKSHLRQVIADVEPDRCVIELPVIIRGPLGDELRRVVDSATALRLPPCEYITPSQWKPVAGKLHIPGGTKHLTIHERDAYRMGRYWLQLNQRSD